MSKFYFLLIICVIVSAFSLKLRSSPNTASFVMNESFSSFSLNGAGGIPETHIRSMTTEEYHNKNGDNKEEVRKYGELFAKDNNDPAILKQKATTNVEAEKNIINTNPVVKMSLDNDQVNNYIKKFDKMFNVGRENTAFPNIFKNIDLSGFWGEDSLMSHGGYSKFLNDRKEELITTKTKKHKKQIKNLQFE